MTPESFQLRQISSLRPNEEENGVEGVKPEKMKVGVGGGLMGGGIAYVTSTKAGVPVRIKDVRAEGIANAMKYSYDILSKGEKRFMRNSKCKLLALLRYADYSGYRMPISLLKRFLKI